MVWCHCFYSPTLTWLFLVPPLKFAGFLYFTANPQTQKREGARGTVRPSSSILTFASKCKQNFKLTPPLYSPSLWDSWILGMSDVQADAKFTQFHTLVSHAGQPASECAQILTLLNIY